MDTSSSLCLFFPAISALAADIEGADDEDLIFFSSSLAAFASPSLSVAEDRDKNEIGLAGGLFTAISMVLLLGVEPFAEEVLGPSDEVLGKDCDLRVLNRGVPKGVPAGDPVVTVDSVIGVIRLLPSLVRLSICFCTTGDEALAPDFSVVLVLGVADSALVTGMVAELLDGFSSGSNGSIRFLCSLSMEGSSMSTWSADGGT